MDCVVHDCLKYHGGRHLHAPYELQVRAPSRENLGETMRSSRINKIVADQGARPRRRRCQKRQTSTRIAPHPPILTYPDSQPAGREGERQTKLLLVASRSRLMVEGAAALQADISGEIMEGSGAPLDRLNIAVNIMTTGLAYFI